MLVRAYQTPPEPVGEWSAEDRRKVDEVVSRQVEAVDERAKELEEVPGSHLEVTVAEGNVATVILRVAEDDQGILVT